jgi:single-strand binding protein
MINSVTLIGRVTQDIEVRKTNTNKSVASFTLAVGDKNSESSFINMTAWNKTAELLAQYAPKGKQIGVTGRLQTRMWEKDGDKRKATEVIVEQVQFLSDGKAQVAKSSEDLGTPVNLNEIPF